MKITDELISRLEKLAQLDLPAEEREQLRRDLEKMTDLMSTLSDLDIKTEVDAGFDPESTVGWRADKADSPMKVEDAIRQAPKQDGTYFLVPKVISSSKKEKP